MRVSRYVESKDVKMWQYRADPIAPNTVGIGFVKRPAVQNVRRVPRVSVSPTVVVGVAHFLVAIKVLEISFSALHMVEGRDAHMKVVQSPL